MLGPSGRGIIVFLKRIPYRWSQSMLSKEEPREIKEALFIFWNSYYTRLDHRLFRLCYRVEERRTTNSQRTLRIEWWISLLCPTRVAWQLLKSNYEMPKPVNICYRLLNEILTNISYYLRRSKRATISISSSLRYMSHDRMIQLCMHFIIYQTRRLMYSLRTAVRL